MRPIMKMETGKEKDLNRFSFILVVISLSLFAIIFILYLFFYQYFNDFSSNNFASTLYPLKSIIKDFKVGENTTSITISLIFEPLLQNFRINEVSTLPSNFNIIQTLFDSTGNLIDNKTFNITNEKIFTSFHPLHGGTYQIKLYNTNSSAIEVKGNFNDSTIILNNYSKVISLIKGFYILAIIVLAFAIIIYIWIKLKIPMT